MRLACELGKWPDEVVEHLSMEAAQEWAGYFALQHEGTGPRELKPADDIEATLFKALGAPGK